jgi:hypothetical protein
MVPKQARGGDGGGRVVKFRGAVALKLPSAEKG